MKRKRKDGPFLWGERYRQFISWIQLLPHLQLFWEHAPTEIRELLLADKWPSVRFQYAGNAPSWWSQAQVEIEESWRGQVIYPTPGGRAFPAEEGITIFFPLINRVVKSYPIREEPKFREYAVELMGYCRYVLDEASQRMTDSVEDVLLERARIGEGLYLMKPVIERFENDHGRLDCEITPIEPEMDRVEIEGKSRPIFRVALPIQYGEMKWWRWPASLLGRNSDDLLDVYVQQHCLRRLAERLQLYSQANSPKLAARSEGVFELSLAYSLAAPQISQRHGDDFWVKYMYGEDHLGYLIAQMIGARVVIKTFLLCGMLDTPEAKRAHELNLDNSAIRYLKLDRLEEWMQSDFKAIPDIAAGLNACGFGGLLAMASLPYHKQVNAASADITKIIDRAKLRRLLGGGVRLSDGLAPGGGQSKPLPPQSETQP